MMKLKVRTLPRTPCGEGRQELNDTILKYSWVMRCTKQKTHTNSNIVRPANQILRNPNFELLGFEVGLIWA
jgi:hypothetical protein